MATIQFNRESLAGWYAKRHLEIDPGIISIRYLPSNAPEREIRLLEINELIAERYDEVLEPIDFGVDRGLESAHQLFVLDVTPNQWERIEHSFLALPVGWSLEEAVLYRNHGDE